VALTFEEAYSMGKASRLAMDQHGLGRNECIIGTRVGLAVAKYFGTTAVPVAGEVVAQNAVTGRRISGGDIEFTPDGNGEFDSTWALHLWMILDKQWLVDVTADQLDIPEKNFHIGGPLVVDTMGQAPRAGTKFAAIREDPKDPDATVGVEYTVVGDGVWRHFRPWKETHLWKPIAATAIKMLTD